MVHCSQPIRRTVLSDRGTMRFRVTGRWFAYRAEMVFGDCHCVFVVKTKSPSPCSVKLWELDGVVEGLWGGS